MPKAEKGSLKDLGKRVKAKGLQKLRFWCEMCAKQCRDANGFKCHLQAETHLRQMKLFSENAGSILKRKSVEFEGIFLEHLRLRHSNAQVNANNVYQEVIRDKSHVHMNATMWASLSDFVQYLGKTGKCQVEENERGWYVKYVPRQDAATMAQREQQQLRQDADRRAEEEYTERMERLRKAASVGSVVCAPTNLVQEAAENLRLELPSSVLYQKTKMKNLTKPCVFDEESEDEKEEKIPEDPPVAPPIPPSNKRQREDVKPKPPPKKKKATPTAEAPWLCMGIIVRIVHKKKPLKDYFQQKAVVEELMEDGYMARVRLLDNDDDTCLRVDQSHVETVVPKRTGETVRIVRGLYRGQTAVVQELDKKKYRGVLQLNNDNKTISLDFEDFCKEL
jgi:DNA/RNA-binding protein KIN17